MLNAVYNQIDRQGQSQGDQSSRDQSEIHNPGQGCGSSATSSRDRQRLEADRLASERPDSQAGHARVLVCPGCGNEIDPDVCWCGSEQAYHCSDLGHSFVPMGCDCGRTTPVEEAYIMAELHRLYP